ncbi:HTH-type transcriptional repressor AseR [Weizmannia acidilactici]|uniref:HTH-type transcriptional repressor AseR n=1 Tax=Weizmannia acidilactici TaxID=2607726 RepID=A0A5J4JL85_9BACI|nr:metalloregulator ArsR/SmtB family transcription factor [Weizmannia acidilactici]GER68294.1 HTH-type transcriptional repressor AseR [Weizmannia acidilactici]GER71328.1 HTH-type transcriptional repressor AseR [Weizmannia acidilactici]GER75198.1 HTH-type transcriptional repressor AseR [Weizmannia acidilactici]
MLNTLIELDNAAAILKLLGDKTRLSMMKILDGETCCVCEFVEMFQMSQPAVSQHLRKLKDMGLVQEEKKGQWVYYSIRKSNEYYPFVKQILDQLPAQNEKLHEMKRLSIGNSCC